MARAILPVAHITLMTEGLWKRIPIIKNSYFSHIYLACHG